MTKKPDNIVYSESEGYNAKLLPYATNIGAPAIKIDDVVNWKVTGIHKVNKSIESKFNDLKAEYNRLIEEYQWNELIYNAKFNFEPVVGEIYHLYKNKKGDHFLSPIAPTEWNQEFICTASLNSDRKWEILDLTI